jgi:protoheme IX farnesyltransferase
MSATADAAPYFALLKPAKFIRLFGAFALATVVALPLSWQDVKLVAVALAAGCIIAAGANALNMFTDRDLDARNRRTADRPLPAGKVHPWAALAIALGLIAIGAGTLWGEAGIRPAAFVLAVVALYATLYAWLKRNTSYYTLVGGALWAAPIPALWLALGRPIAGAPMGAFAVAAIWTALHVWSTALVHGGGAAEAAPRFLPNECRPQVTRLYILALTGALALIVALIGPRPMLSFVGLLMAAAVLSLCIQTVRADRWVTGAAMVFIAAFIAFTAVDNVVPTFMVGMF